VTLPLASLRDLEELLRHVLAGVEAARRSIEERRSTRAAVELDGTVARLGICREVVHDLLETAGHAVERSPARGRAALAAVLAEWKDDAARACAASGVALRGAPAAHGHFELDAAKLRRLLRHLVSAAVLRGSGELELRCTVAAEGPSRALLAFEAERRPAPRAAAEPQAAELAAARLAQVLGGRFEKAPLRDGSALVLRAVVPARVLAAVEAASAPASLAGARVLVVEDDEDARHALALLLEDWELDVVAAATFDEALAAAGQGAPFRLALLDVDLNGRSGLDLRERLLARQPALPVIFLSGSDARRGLATGPRVRYLVKPVDVPALEAAVRELLEAALAVGADATP